jgi:dTDP-glucose 4,6-dehydratase/UDP-glucuronate decarboxylase
LCSIFNREFDVPVRIVRPFNNYGPGLRIDDGRVLADFARDVIEERDLVLLSDGAPRRTFCYVADAVVGYYRALVRGRPGEPYNIGADAPEISMRELAETFRGVAARITGYRGDVKLSRSSDPAYLTDNPQRRCPDISKARAELGFTPEYSLERGLENYLQWAVHERRAMP